MQNRKGTPRQGTDLEDWAKPRQPQAPIAPIAPCKPCDSPWPAWTSAAEPLSARTRPPAIRPWRIPEQFETLVSYWAQKQKENHREKGKRFSAHGGSDRLQQQALLVIRRSFLLLLGRKLISGCHGDGCPFYNQFKYKLVIAQDSIASVNCYNGSAV